MDPAQAMVAVVAVAGALAFPLALMYMWIHRPSATREIANRHDLALEARLERIEVAVQAIALETERIAEGQRFTTKLLTGAPDQLAEQRAGQAANRNRSS
jgi:hypothetical protein